MKLVSDELQEDIVSYLERCLITGPDAHGAQRLLNEFKRKKRKKNLMTSPPLAGLGEPLEERAYNPLKKEIASVMRRASKKSLDKDHQVV